MNAFLKFSRFVVVALAAFGVASGVLSEALPRLAWLNPYVGIVGAAVGLLIYYWLEKIPPAAGEVRRGSQ